MTPYTRRLLAGTNITSPVTGTVPAGKAWVITNMTAVPRDASKATAFLATITPCLIWALTTTQLNINQTFFWEGKCALNAGENLTMQGFIGPWDFQATGYVFDA